MNFNIQTIGSQAKSAADKLCQLCTEEKNSIILEMADSLDASRQSILEENALDVAEAKKNNVDAALLERLFLDDKRIDSMIVALREVAALPDPIGAKLDSFEHSNGLKIVKRRSPIGVIGIIYESRPNVSSDAASLCFKSSNAVVLRGGKESIRSNQAIVRALTEGGLKAGMPQHAIQLIQTSDRNAVKELVQAVEYIDLVIPRGGESLIKAVSTLAHVPVIKHYKGTCHVFVDKSADLSVALNICENAKCQRPGVCNSIETILVHQSIAETFLPDLCKILTSNQVELRGDSSSRNIFPMKEATEADWHEEYLRLCVSIKVVDSLSSAIKHINFYGSHHSDAIVTTNEINAAEFLNRVDSAAVYLNSSTRFTDGGEFGMGAEIGISTDKIHARGPMGLPELTTYKWIVRGDGQIRE
jgi:glutamate-5-semialdehyde dehydrogenase